MLLLALAIGIAIRIPFLFLPSNDSWVALFHLERLRLRSWFDFTLQNSVFPARDGYPILLHLLVSRLPRRYWHAAGTALILSGDTLTAVLIYVTVMLHFGGTPPDIAGLPAPIIAALLFLTCPVLFTPMSRLRTLNSRVTGLPLVTFFFLLIYLYLSSPMSAAWTPAILIAATLIAVVIYATSQFAAQVIVFFSVFLSLAYFDIGPALVVLSATGLCLIPRLGLVPVLLHHRDFKIWYFRNYLKGTTAAERNSLASLRRTIRENRPASWLSYFTRLNTLTIALIGVPALWAVLLIYVTEGGSILDSPLGQFSWYVILASLACFLVVSLPAMSFLGQAERYFEYSAPFLAIALVIVPAFSIPAVIWSIFFLQVLGGALFFLATQPTFTRGRAALFSPNLLSIAEWITKNAPNARLLVNPVKYAYLLSVLAYRGLLPTAVRLYYRFALRPDEVGFAYFEKDITSPFDDSNETLVNRDPLEMREEYELTHLLLEKSHLPFFGEASPYRRLAEDSRSKLIENEEFVLVDLRRAQPS